MSLRWKKQHAHPKTHSLTSHPNGSVPWYWRFFSIPCAKIPWEPSKLSYHHSTNALWLFPWRGPRNIYLLCTKLRRFWEILLEALASTLVSCPGTSILYCVSACSPCALPSVSSRGLCVSHGSNLSALKVCASKLKSLGLSGAFRNWLNAFSYAALILRTTCFMTGAAWLCWRIAFIDLWSYERTDTLVGLCSWKKGFPTQIHRIVCCFIEQIVEFVRRPILPHYTK